jgi:hypothetical protein
MHVKNAFIAAGRLNAHSPPTDQIAAHIVVMARKPLEPKASKQCHGTTRCAAKAREQNRAAIVFDGATKKENELMKKLLLAAGLVLAATSASMAQGYGYYGAPNGSGLYDYAPGYSYGGNWYDNDRSDGPGRGNSAESQR